MCDELYAARQRRFQKAGSQSKLPDLVNRPATGQDDMDADEGNVVDTGQFEDVVFDGGLKVPGYIWHRLFDYQQTGVKWLWELHTQRAGGHWGDVAVLPACCRQL